MNIWTNEEIEQILIQLDEQKLPFNGASFEALGEGMTVLGRGASSTVYRGFARKNEGKTCAIKVIGFGNSSGDAMAFREAIKAQMRLSLTNINVVQIKDYKEIRVWIEGENTVVKTEIIDEYSEGEATGDYLDLRFALMEEIEPVVSGKKYGKPQLIPAKLEFSYEDEILKMAYDIGHVLNEAHKDGVLHRDIKLENVFYSYKDDRYKLGDFGIAKLTDTGMASTIAFTKGYGAPEVVYKSSDKYDNTADIYSFGMMLYVLLNELRFPQSKNYCVNLQEQYRTGYVPPRPSTGSDELVNIVFKMCSYNPDDRYQSMEEVLNDIETLIFKTKYKTNRAHRKSSVALGIVFVFVGASLLFLIKDIVINTKCASIVLINLGIILLFRYGLLDTTRDEQVLKLRKKNVYKWYVILFYIVVIATGLTVKNLVGNPENLYDRLFGNGTADLLNSCKLEWAGIYSVTFWILWGIREWVLSKTNK